MTAAVIRLPSLRVRRARERFALERNESRLGEFDEEMRVIETAIDTLRKRHRAVLADYADEMARLRRERTS